MKFSLFALGAKSQMAGVAGVLSAVLAAPSAAGDPGLSAGERQLPAAERQLQQSAGWHGRAVREPHAHAVAPAAREAPPRGWSAGAVSRGSGYWHAGGSERVREVQRGLNRLGYEPGRVDGLFGPRTEGAVQQFQRKHGLKVDGVVGPQTRRHLRYRSAQGKRRSSAGQRLLSPGQEPQTNSVEQAESGTREAPQSDDSGWGWRSGALGLLLLALGLIARGYQERRRGVTAARAEARAPVTAGPPAGPEAPQWVLGYVGAAPSEQASDGDGAAAQEAAIRADCERRGWDLLELVRDREENGGSLERPAIAQALARIEAGEASGLIVSRLDLLSRSVADLGKLLEWFDAARATLVALDRGIDTSTAEGRRVAEVLVSMAAWERQRIAERTRQLIAKREQTRREEGA